MADEDVTITEQELAALKNDVLKENIEEISSQLGDPGRYFASFKAKDILDQSDCEVIKGQATSVEKAMAFIDTIRDRKGRKGEHPYDVFVGALKRMKVHIHIVRILNQALARKRAELKTVKRAEMPTVTAETGSQSSHSQQPVHNGFPSNSTVQERGALPSATTNSSPTSSSSSSAYATTPPSYVTSPRNETDCSLVSPHTSTSDFPSLPTGYNKMGVASADVPLNTPESVSQTTPPDIDPEAGPIPSDLPIGFNKDGSRQVSDVAAIIDQSLNEDLRPDVGPLPPAPPPVSGHAFEEQFQDMPLPFVNGEGSQLIIALKDKIASLESSHAQLSDMNMHLKAQLEDMQKTIILLEDDLIQVNKEKERMAKESGHKDRTIRHLESQINVLQQGLRVRPVGTPVITTPMTTPNRLLSPNYYPPSHLSHNPRRVTDPFIKDVPPPKYFGHQHHRTSEPVLQRMTTQHTSHPASRPNNLPLGISENIPFHLSPQDTPSYTYSDGRYVPVVRTRHSPGSDSSQDGGGLNRYRISSSADDLTSGGEDKGSVHSFGSNNSNSKVTFELSSANNTHSTVV